jgi:hypothetical protein
MEGGRHGDGASQPEGQAEVMEEAKEAASPSAVSSWTVGHRGEERRERTARNYTSLGSGMCLHTFL